MKYQKRIINKQKIDFLESSHSDLLYMWGAFLKIVLSHIL